MVEQSSTTLPALSCEAAPLGSEQHLLNGCIVADAKQQHIHAGAGVGWAGTSRCTLELRAGFGFAAAGVHPQRKPARCRLIAMGRPSAPSPTKPRLKSLLVMTHGEAFGS